MTDERELLRRTAEIAADFLETLDERPVFPASMPDELDDATFTTLPDAPSDALDVLEAVGTRGRARRRRDGWARGTSASSPGARCRRPWQSTGCSRLGPEQRALRRGPVRDDRGAGRRTAGRRTSSVFRDASVAFVTGCQMAHVTRLAAARHAFSHRPGWDVASDGLWGAPTMSVVAGGSATCHRRPRLYDSSGSGTNSIVVVRRRRAGTHASRRASRDARRLDGPVIVCAQAGEVNTGSFDPLRAIVDISHEAGAWLHVDGAFGLWAAASPSRRSLIDGHARSRLLGVRRAQVAERAVRLRCSPSARTRMRIAHR